MSLVKNFSKIFVAALFLFTASIASAADQYQVDANAKNKYDPYAQADIDAPSKDGTHVKNRPHQIGIYVTPKIGYSGIIATNIKNKYSAGGASYSEPGDAVSTSAFAGGIAVGYDSWPQQEHKIVGVRTELEYMARLASKYSWDYDWGGFVEKGDIKINAQTLFVNSYLDFHTGSPFVPYLQAGIGAAFIQTKLNERLEYAGESISASNTETTTNFAGNLGVGTAIELNENLAIDINTRYVMLGKGKASVEAYGISGQYEGNLSSVEALVGLRIGF